MVLFSFNFDAASSSFSSMNFFMLVWVMWCVTSLPGTRREVSKTIHLWFGKLLCTEEKKQLCCPPKIRYLLVNLKVLFHPVNTYRTALSNALQDKYTKIPNFTSLGILGEKCLLFCVDSGLMGVFLLEKFPQNFIPKRFNCSRTFGHFFGLVPCFYWDLSAAAGIPAEHLLHASLSFSFI